MEAPSTSESSDTERSAIGIDPGAIQRAKRMDFEGDAPRSRARPEEDPARGFELDDRRDLSPDRTRQSHRLSEENTRQCRNFCAALSKAIDATAVVFGVDLEIKEEEHRLLGDAWGDVLRHHVTIKDGSYRGDWMAAVGESTAVIVSRKDKIKRIAEERRRSAETEEEAENE